MIHEGEHFRKQSKRKKDAWNQKVMIMQSGNKKESIINRSKSEYNNPNYPT